MSRSLSLPLSIIPWLSICLSLHIYFIIDNSLILTLVFIVPRDLHNLYWNGQLGLALYNIVVRIMVRVDVRVRVTQG